MKRKLCGLLFRWLGWTYEVSVPDYKKCILCVAPHTSNWDFFFGKLFYAMQGKWALFLMKKEWFIGPLGYFLRKMGGIPVDRNGKHHLTDALARKAHESERFQLTVTPEGTRKRNAHWKAGFYFIALKAKLPILLYAIDYKLKKISCTKVIFPSGDMEKDMKEIKAYYRRCTGKHPAQFATE